MLKEARYKLQEAATLVLEANRLLTNGTLEESDLIREPFVVSA